MATSLDLAHRLLGAAEQDELAASSLLPIEAVTDGILGFHAQQAVEKAIKAVLAYRETEFPFIHSLKQLREFAKEHGIELPATLDGVEALTPFAADERYGAETPIGLDRDKALQWATDAVAWARTVIDAAAPESEQPPQPDPTQSPPDPD